MTIKERKAREKKLTAIKEKAKKEVEDFRNNEYIKKGLPEFNDDCLFKAIIANALEKYCDEIAAFNGVDEFGGYILDDITLDYLIYEKTKILPIIFDIFIAKDFGALNCIRSRSIADAIDMINFMLYETSIKEEN